MAREIPKIKKLFLCICKKIFPFLIGFVGLLSGLLTLIPPSFFKSNAFLPILLSSKIRFLTYMISDNLKTYNVTENCLREFYSVPQSQHTREFFLRNPNINSALLDIFSPLIKEIPNISKEIEKEFGKKSSKSKK